MTKTKGSTSIIILDEEIDRLVFLCSHIAQMATNIRLVHLTNLCHARENLSFNSETLLSAAENIEGSLMLLESLLASEQRNLRFNEHKRARRIHYTKEKLLQLKTKVTDELSSEIEVLLRQVIERECNDSVETERKSWRDIRTILM